MPSLCPIISFAGTSMGWWPPPPKGMFKLNFDGSLNNFDNWVELEFLTKNDNGVELGA